MNAGPWIVAAALCASASWGCERVGHRLDFERMIDQAKYEPYEATDVFADGRVMRHPPEGTVPIDRVLDMPEVTKGVRGGAEVVDIPIEVDRALLARGRDRFERFCGACHGPLGTGNPAVVENARLRPPPSLHLPHIVAQPPGRIFLTITWGYGLMPSYRSELPPRDRWAVIAYLQVLQQSQSVEMAILAPELQAEAREALSGGEAR